MNAKEWTGEVVSNGNRVGNYFVLSLAVPKTFNAPNPGSFLMLSVGDEPSTSLRRPMAIFDVVAKGSRKELKILYSVFGKGTQILSAVKKGAHLSFLGPIGNAFSFPKPTEKFLAVAGGIGIAPFLIYGRQLPAKRRKNVSLLFGFRTREQMKILKEFKPAGLKILTAVEEKGAGFHGNAVELMKRRLSEEKYDRILTCGPSAMMEAVKNVALPLGIPVEASLEVKMACGVGACLSCVTLGPDGRYELVCQQGPVFTYPAHE